MFRQKQTKTVLSLSFLLMFIGAFIAPVHAETWQDALFLCSYTTTVHENIRNITNTASFPVKVTAYYQNAVNISHIKLFLLSANGTNFVNISDGVVITESNSYEPLQSGEILVFTVKARPSDTIVENETALVRVNVVAESIETGGRPWRPVVTTQEIECTLDTAPNIELSLGHIIANRLPIHYVVSIRNKANRALFITIRSWTTDLFNYKAMYFSSNKTLLVGPNLLVTQNFDFTLPISLTNLRISYVLHVSFDYDIDDKHYTTKDLLATISIDASPAITTFVVIVSGVFVIALLLYIGLFRGRLRRKRLEKETSGSK